MTQSELMYAIGNAMHRNPEGWWEEFEYNNGYEKKSPFNSGHALQCLAWNNLSPRPSTYTLHIEDMPTPLREAPTIGRTYWWVDNENLRVRDATWGVPQIHRLRLHAGLCYPDEQTAREALEKLTGAMGI